MVVSREGDSSQFVPRSVGGPCFPMGSQDEAWHFIFFSDTNISQLCYYSGAAEV